MLENDDARNAVPTDAATPIDGDQPAEPHVVGVLAVPHHVPAPDVGGEHRVERRDVGRHARHERRQQTGDRDAEHTVGQQLLHQVGDRVVVLQARVGGADLRDQDRGDQARDHHQEDDEDLREGARSAGCAGPADRFFADSARCTSAKFVVQ